MKRLFIFMIIIFCCLAGFGDTFVIDYIEIGEWDMDNHAYVIVNLPVSNMLVVGINVWIRGDHSDVSQYPLDYQAIGENKPYGSYHIVTLPLDIEVIVLWRRADSPFNGPAYDNDNNRGWIILTYRIVE